MFICRKEVCIILLIGGLDVHFCFVIVFIHVQFFMYRACLIWFSYTLFQEMACLNSVVSASDQQFVNVHLELLSEMETNVVKKDLHTSRQISVGR